MLWASPHAGFLESDRLSTTQVEKTGISNRIQIFLSWKRKKKLCHWITCRCLQNWCLRKWIIFFPRMLKWRVHAGSRMCMAEREKKKKKVFLATLHGYCLQPFFFYSLSRPQRFRTFLTNYQHKQRWTKGKEKLAGLVRNSFIHFSSISTMDTWLLNNVRTTCVELLPNSNCFKL